MSDAARGRAVRFRPFSKAEQARVRTTVRELVTVSNPFDYHTFDWGDEERLAATFTAVMDCGFDLGVLVIDFPRAECGAVDEWHGALGALRRAAQASGGRTAVLASLAENLPEALARDLMAKGVAPLCGIDDGLAAIEAAAFIGRARRDAQIRDCARCDPARSPAPNDARALGTGL